MTFAEYNTDENFNRPSNAMELVKLGFNEGKTREEIENSLSPLWKEDKKGNVKKALDTYFKPTEEPKIVEEQKIETPTPKADKTTEFLNKTNNIGLTAEKNEMENQQQLKIKSCKTSKKNAALYLPRIQRRIFIRLYLSPPR